MRKGVSRLVTVDEANAKAPPRIPTPKPTGQVQKPRKPIPDLRPQARKLLQRITAVQVNGPRLITDGGQERLLGAEHALKTLLGLKGAYLTDWLDRASDTIKAAHKERYPDGCKCGVCR